MIISSRHGYALQLHMFNNISCLLELVLHTIIFIFNCESKSVHHFDINKIPSTIHQVIYKETILNIKLIAFLSTKSPKSLRLGRLEVQASSHTSMRPL